MGYRDNVSGADNQQGSRQGWLTPQRLHAELLDKRCSNCGTIKPIDEFHRRLDKYQPCCKACRREDAKARYERKKQENPDFLVSMNERSKRWQAANPDKKAEAQRRRIKANREHYRQINRDWRSKNKDKALLYARRWAEKNPDKIRLYAKQKRVGRRNDLGVMYAEVLADDPCAFCGARPVEIDHIEPRKRGGSDHWLNLTAACRSCNATKRTDTLLLFLLRRAESRMKI